MDTPENFIVTTPNAALSANLARIAAEAGAVGTRWPAITHLVALHWDSEEGDMCPFFTVLLRADDTAFLVNATNQRGDTNGRAATFRLLAHLGIKVESIALNLGRPKPGYPAMPVSLAGVYPESKNLAPLLENPVFVRWLKSMKSRFVDPDTL